MMRRAKKFFLAFFFSALMIWQGFFLSKAEGEVPFVLPETQMYGENAESENAEMENSEPENTEPENATEVENESLIASAVASESDREAIATEVEEEKRNYDHKPISFSKEVVDGKILKIEDTNHDSHYVLEYRITFDAKNFKGTHNAEGYNHLVLKDSLDSTALEYMDPYYMDFTVEDSDRFKPLLRRGVWRSGELREDNGKKYFDAAIDDEENRGSIFSLREDMEGENSAVEEEAGLDYGEEGIHSGEFQIDLGELGPTEGFELRYFVEIKEIPVNKAMYKNKVRLEGADIKPIEHTYTVTGADESAEEKAYSIEIKLTDKDSDIPLKGSVYLLSKKYSRFKKTIETNGEGIAIAKNLRSGEYELEEILPPDGYKLDKSVHEFGEDLFGDNKKLEFNFQNEKEDSKTRNVIVEKKWPVLVRPGSPSTASLLPDGIDNKEDFDPPKMDALDVLGDSEVPAHPDKIIVHLLQNGRREESLKAELSEKNGWVYVFENLKRYDEKGDLIQYSVEEESVPGYSSLINGSMSTKFTITNYYTEGHSIPIPVRKEWEGDRYHPYEVKIQLLAYGKIVDSVRLNERNDWKHSFFVYEKDGEGKEIPYELKELPVPGYSSRKEKIPGSAFGAVFINKKIEDPETDNPKPNPPGEELIPPDSPDNGGNTPEHPFEGGNRRTPPSGNNPPSTVEVPVFSVVTPPSSEQNSPGEVLGTDRTQKNIEEMKDTSVLGANRTSADQEPQVLGAGRGGIETSDSSALGLYALFFFLSTVGFALSLLYGKNRVNGKR